ncbi:MAG TPA: DUF5666 domain-containing protein [Thermoanaerobaculia bacterium]|nr:DUF5666 domain-containing protein [Thermoanaerobaculia bacterium]
MTFVSLPPRTACPNIRSKPTALAVVALVLSVPAVFAMPALAQGTMGTAMIPIAAPASTVDSVVLKVNGPILDVLGGALQIDVTNARITGGEDRLASPLPWAGILVGSRIVAHVTVPDAIPAVFPPRLPATSVVVFLTNSGSLSGTVQGVGAAQGTFTLLYTSVKTNAGTEWSGSKADGSPVKGLSDLAIGMQAVTVVSTDASGVTAKSVHAYTIPTTRIEAFRGKVEKIDASAWTVDGKFVQVNADTKIVGDPKVGDVVDVLAKVTIVPPGMGMPSMPPVAISIVKVISTPPPPTDRSVEFDGVVESMPPGLANSAGAALGHWKISGKDVLVTPATRVASGIGVGSSVHVKGVTLPMAVFAPTASPQILATEITKK